MTLLTCSLFLPFFCSLVIPGQVLQTQRNLLSERMDQKSMKLLAKQVRTDGLPANGAYELSVTDGLNPIRRVVVFGGNAAQ